MPITNPKTGIQLRIDYPRRSAKPDTTYDGPLMARCVDYRDATIWSLLG
jgi:hypothetical protein